MDSSLKPNTPKGDKAGLLTFLKECKAEDCCMAHEVVSLDAEGKPKKDGLGNYQRSLCPREKRETQLSCAHSTVRQEVSRRLKQLDIDYFESLSASKDELIQELRNLDAEIGQVDWKKGDLEKEKAELLDCSEKLPLDTLTLRREALNQSLRAQIRAHQFLNQRLRKIRTAIVEELAEQAVKA